MKSVSAAIFYFLFSIHLFAQHETDQRVIGFKYVLKFNANNPQVVTKPLNLYKPFNPNYKGDLQTPHANSICDTMGNLLFYYDGTSVYRPNGEVMTNGTLHEYNFSSYYNNALIVPIEESNRRYYYLFETIPHKEKWDYAKNTPLNCPANIYCFEFWNLCKLQYHIIDMQANDGKGGVLKKNIFITDSVAPSISGIKHRNNIDTWVSVLKFQTNNILNYRVNSCAIQVPVISSVPDFEYKQVPGYVSSYSPNGYTGFQIVYSTKGDYTAFLGNKASDSNSSTSTPPPFYLFVVAFDNQTGLLDFSTLKAISVKSGGDANLFSHDSKYLYYHDTDFFVPIWIYQYDVQTQQSIPMYYNKGTSDNLYSGTDYGKNNSILIYKVRVKPNSQAGLKYVSYLGAVKYIDQPFVSSNLIDSLLLPGMDQPDDKPLYTYIARNNYIYNFYHPDYKKPPAFPVPSAVTGAISSPACFASPVHLAGHSSGSTDSAFWFVQKEPDTSWQKYAADTCNLSLGPGTYQANYVPYKYCLSFGNAPQQFVLEGYPHVQLPADSVYTCDSKPVDLPPVNTTYHAHWVNAAGTMVASPVPDPGLYMFVVENSCGIASDSLHVKNSLMEVTNLVTANNDEKNDCLYAVSNNPVEKVRLSIYNCWGSRIFYDEQYSNNWCPDNEISDGIYFYETTYNNNCSKKGWVQVIH